MKDKYVVACVGMICATSIVTVTVAVCKIDGALVGSALAVIGTIVGYVFGKSKTV